MSNHTGMPYGATFPWSEFPAQCAAARYPVLAYLCGGYFRLFVSSLSFQFTKGQYVCLTYVLILKLTPFPSPQVGGNRLHPPVLTPPDSCVELSGAMSDLEVQKFYIKFVFLPLLFFELSLRRMKAENPPKNAAVFFTFSSIFSLAFYSFFTLSECCIVKSAT